MALDFNQSIRNKKNTGKSIIWFRFFLVVFLVIVCFVFARFIFKGMTLVKNTGADLLVQTIDLTTPKNVLIARQQELQHQNELLQQQLNTFQLVEDENASLRAMLDYPKMTSTAIVARVIVKPSQNIYDRIMIDRGTSDGVVIGDRVIAGENGLIATIDQVTDSTAQGTLISGSFWKGDAVIARLGITVPVDGKGSGNFELHVPRDMDVRDGDVMTLPGSPDFVFGVIKSIQFDERDPYQTVLARTPVNVQELKFVRVVK
jgi:rod shape-determining protein MreC